MYDYGLSFVYREVLFHGVVHNGAIELAVINMYLPEACLIFLGSFFTFVSPFLQLLCS